MKTIPAIVLTFFVFVTAIHCEQFSISFGGENGMVNCADSQAVIIGLAISGGGARGLATIGILKAFEEKGIRVEAIAGTSMGGIMGGLYACGYDADDLAALVDRLQFDSLFNNSPPRKTMFLTQRTQRERHLVSIRLDGWRPVIPTGLTKGQKLTSLLTELTTPAVFHAGGRFTKLPIPFKTVTTDIENGEAVVLDSGSLANAMRATMAFPLAFTPVIDNDRQLMDGGILVPIPVSILREMLDDDSYVVAINTASSLLSREELNTPIDIANQVTTIMTAEKLESELYLADYVIAPDLKDYESTAFDKKDEIIEIGYLAGLKAADSIIIARSHLDTSGHLTISGISGPAAESPVGHDIALRLNGRETTNVELFRILREEFCRHELFGMTATMSSMGNEGGYLMDLSTRPPVQRADYEFRIDGNSVFSDSVLMEQMALEYGVITPTSLRRAQDRMLNHYYVNGIDLADITKTEFDFENRRITMHLDEGRVARIDVDDNIRTRDWFVRTHFPLKPGHPYSSELASQGVDNIYGTDLFNRVTLGVERYKTGAIVKIGVDEKYYRQVRLGWHWHETYESEQFLQFIDDNLLGMGLEGMLHAQYAPDHQKYYGSFQLDRIWSTYLTARASAFHNRLNRHVYDKESNETGERKERRSGVSFSVGQQIARLGAVSAGFWAERVDYLNLPDNTEVEFDLVRLQLSSLVESFDRTPFTVSGNRSEVELQVAGDYLGSDVEFRKLHATFEQYIPLTEELNFNPRLDIGISASGLTPSEKFYLGGSRSFYGYQTSQLPGDKLLHFSYSLRIKLPLNFYVSVRHDIGEVYEHTDQIKLRNLRHGVGISLALDTPMGPFSISHGLAKNDNEETYFNLGFDF